MFFGLVLNLNVNGQELRLFSIESRDLRTENAESKGFISLSDIDRLSDHPDSTALPDLSPAGNAGKERFEYIELEGEYRNRFFSRTGISETERVFIYSYSEDKLVSMTVSDLKVVAWLNFYMSYRDCPCPDYYYQIGFVIENEFLQGFENYDTNSLVSVGEKNPFVRNQVEPIVWQKIDSTQFPRNLTVLEPEDITQNQDNTENFGHSYLFENEEYRFFIREHYERDQRFWLRLLILDLESDERVFEKIFYAGESATFAPRDNQWAGHLFKDQPMVIFGFQYHSFWCPIIDFVDFEKDGIRINCDNRH